MSDMSWFIVGGVFAMAAAIFYAAREIWIHRRRARNRTPR
jgi:hypothetical protein